MTINNVNQPLPISPEFERFWSTSENKIGLQQFFISWLTENYKYEKPVYLGGCHVGGKDLLQARKWRVDRCPLSEIL